MTPAGGKIASKGQVFRFEASDLVAGFIPRAGDEVSFDPDQANARRVRPPEVTATLPPPGPESAAGVPGPPSRGSVTRVRPSGRSGGNAGRPAPVGGNQIRTAAPLLRTFPPPGSPGAFVNPYNFVPLAGAPRRLPVGAPHLAIRGQTGQLTVEIELLTPGSISPIPSGTGRDGIPVSRPRRDEAGKVWFPGSSVKGQVRTLFEVLSQSCLSIFDGDARPSWRPVEPSAPGFLVFDGRSWWIQPALDIRVRPGPTARSGSPTEVTASDRQGRWYEDRGGKRFTDGVFHITEVPENSTKSWQRVFVRDEDRQPLPVPPDVVQRADLAHERQLHGDADGPEYVDVTLPDGRPGGQRRKRRTLLSLRSEPPGTRRAIWYRPAGGPVRGLGPVALYRTQFFDGRGAAVSLGDALARRGQGPFAPCDGDAGACPACLLFGLVYAGAESEEEQAASSGLRGRVQFGTFRSVGQVPPRMPIELKPLGAPHVSAQTFYLWDPDKPEQSRAPAFANPEAGIRGRKFYWHQADITEDAVTIHQVQRNAIAERPGALAKQVRAVELVPTGTVFSGSIGYDSLSDVELGLLLMALDPALIDPAAATEREICSHVGGGKPLGLGSARITIRSLQRLDPQKRYRSFETEATSALEGVALRVEIARLASLARAEAGITRDRPDVAALLHLLDYRCLDRAVVHYPPGETSDPGRAPNAGFYESYRWFVEFAAKGKGGGAPAPSRSGHRPDPLRTVDEIVAGHYQWGWSQPTIQPPPRRSQR